MLLNVFLLPAYYSLHPQHLARSGVLVGIGRPGLTGGLLTLGSGQVSSPFQPCLHL